MEPIPIAPPPEADDDMVGGPHAARGMRVRFVLLEDMVEGTWVAAEPFGGWVGLAHGTAFAALHDEAAIFAIAYLARQCGFTRRLDVRFARPIRLGQRVRVRARVAKQDARGALVASELLLDDGTVVSTAETEYAFADEATLLRVLGKPLSPYLQAWMRASPEERLRLALERSRAVLPP